ncbi:putative alcohol O-acetyltransferase [Helianthus annuus]|uniref:Alcohol O-acetyltransferase n=1 Tax=Helianthus annuus TaxID=4232 RepID=A0A9K3N7C8_HELAN|nr:putative alcohol O-acetyltransferase [Helianthus annuus]
MQIPKSVTHVLMKQVTELKCGSMIISCAFNHQLSDAYSMSMFLVAWAKHARLEKMSNLPIISALNFEPTTPSSL